MIVAVVVVVMVAVIVVVAVVVIDTEAIVTDQRKRRRALYTISREARLELPCRPYLCPSLGVNANHLECMSA